MSDPRQMVEDYGRAAIACALDTTAENAMNAVRLRQALISEIESARLRAAVAEQVAKGRRGVREATHTCGVEPHQQCVACLWLELASSAEPSPSPKE